MYPEYKEDEKLLLAETFFQNAIAAISAITFPGSYSYMTVNEMAAIYNYTKQGYRSLNQKIHSGAIDELSRSNMRFLNYALSKLPPYTGVTYRGTKLPVSAVKDYQSLASSHNDYTQEFYLSTSTDINTAVDFAGRGNDLYKTLFFTVSKTGRVVHELSDWGPHFKNIVEQEVLFPAGTNFRVLKFYWQQIIGERYLVIEQEEV